MKGYEHSSHEYRHLADELWERGFKEVSTYVHSLAAVKEAEEMTKPGFMGFLDKELDDLHDEVRRALGE